MTEAQLRDLIANNIQALEAGLTLVDKERYIPHGLGTRSFIDLYAKDTQGHHVLIEVKKSDASAREALHEIHKYVEGVKVHLGARDEEIRVVVASTEWEELLVPFSRLVADTSLTVLGLHIHVESSSVVRTTPIAVIPITRGRFIAPWHDVNWYSDRKSLKRGIKSIEDSCAEKGIEDYVVLTLRMPKAVHVEQQAAMDAAFTQIRKMHGKGEPKNFPQLPHHEFIAYFAMQALTREDYLRILQRDPGGLDEIRDSLEDMDIDEALQSLHDAAAAVEPHPARDYLEIGYPAKFAKLLDMAGGTPESIRRYGRFARNSLLDDRSILSELRGNDGSTGQRFKRTLTASSRAHMASARADIAGCLEQNPAWRAHIQRALDEIEHDFPGAEVDVSIYNPGTGVFTIYLSTTNADGLLYVPMYTLTIRDPHPVRMYFGGLEANGSALSFRDILAKYYEGDLWGLLVTMTWGGRESRDADIIEDLGLAYRSFRCDIHRRKRSFVVLRDDRWRPCGPVDIFALFGEYLEQNERLVRQIVEKISPRSVGGVFDGSSATRMLDKAADIARGTKLKRFLKGKAGECDVCAAFFSEEKYMVDGAIRDVEQWAHMCADCFQVHGEGLGWDKGRLYLRDGGKWLLVAGFPPDKAAKQGTS